MLNVISQSVVMLNVVAPVQCLAFQNIKAHHFVSKMGQAGRHDIQQKNTQHNGSRHNDTQQDET